MWGGRRFTHVNKPFLLLFQLQSFLHLLLQPLGSCLLRTYIRYPADYVLEKPIIVDFCIACGQNPGWRGRPWRRSDVPRLLQPALYSTRVLARHEIVEEGYHQGQITVVNRPSPGFGVTVIPVLSRDGKPRIISVCEEAVCIDSTDA